MKYLIRLLAAGWLLLPLGVPADTHTLTIGTNNTPLDRQVLQALSDEAFRRLGKDMKLINLPSERSLRSADRGEIDGEGLRVAGLQDRYPNLVQVDEPYVGISFVAFARDRGIRLDGWSSLADYRLAHVNGWKLFEAKTADAKVVNRVANPEQMFEMLQRDRVDLALYTLADGRAYIRDHGLVDIVALSPSLKDVDLYLYLHKRHARLAKEVGRVLREMKQDGTYGRIIADILGD